MTGIRNGRNGYGRDESRSQNLIAKIDKLSNPKTPEDLIRALNDPLSPLYQKTMNMLMAKAEVADVISHILEKYLVTEQKLDRQDRDNIMLQMKMQLEAAHHKEVIIFLDKQQIAQDKKQLVKLPKENLKSMLEKYEVKITHLKTEIAVANKNIAVAKQQVKVNDQAWSKSMNTVLKNMQTHPIAKTQIGQQYIASLAKAIKETPPISKTIDIVFKSYEDASKASKIGEAQAKTAIVQFAPPPPPPPPLPNAKFICRHALVGVQLRALADMAENSKKLAKTSGESRTLSSFILEANNNLKAALRETADDVNQFAKDKSNQVMDSINNTMDDISETKNKTAAHFMDALFPAQTDALEEIAQHVLSNKEILQSNADKLEIAETKLAAAKEMHGDIKIKMDLHLAKSSTIRFTRS